MTGKAKSEKRIFQSSKEKFDILPKEQVWWDRIWEAGKEVSCLYDFSFIETSLLESAGLFEISLSSAKNVVEEQMFIFKNEKGERLVLRPEGTAPVCRAYLEHRLGYYSRPLKVFYYGPMFSYEKSSVGRRQLFHQWGFEILGDAHPIYDAQIILAVYRFFNLLKIKNVNFRINTVGCRICRPNYQKKLIEYYLPFKKELCQNCQNYLEDNPFRLFNCQNENCRLLRSSAPVILDYLCQNCNNHLREVLEFIEDNNLPYISDPYLMREVDYCNRAVFDFEITDYKLALAKGGRYDYLMERIGGQNLPVVGAAIDIEKTIEAMKEQQIDFGQKSKPKIFFASVGSQAEKCGLVLTENLRRGGIGVCESFGKKSLKAQLKTAGKKNISLVLILGQKEVFEETVILRDTISGIQETISTNKLLEEVRKRLK